MHFLHGGISPYEKIHFLVLQLQFSRSFTNGTVTIHYYFLFCNMDSKVQVYVIRVKNNNWVLSLLTAERWEDCNFPSKSTCGVLNGTTVNKRRLLAKIGQKTSFTWNRFHFFILLPHSFSWKLTDKNDSFTTIFWKNVENFGQLQKLWHWHNRLKLSDTVGKKLKLTARGFAAAVRFNFFRPYWQFQPVSQVTVSCNCPKFQHFFQKRSQKPSLLLSVLRGIDGKKKVKKSVSS